MRLLVHTTVLMWIAMGIQVADAWQYDDDLNRITISGSACRGEDGNAEQNVRHNSGSTSVASGSDPVRLFCPINRRNLYAYDKRLRGRGDDVKIYFVAVIVDSPSQDLRCRLFAKQRLRRGVTYTDWRQPSTHGLLGEPIANPYLILFIMDPEELWEETVNWGVMCDVPDQEAINLITALVKNDNS